MSDLISRQALIELIQHGANKPKLYDGAQEVDWIMGCINEIPTAYDVDKVVEQMQRSCHNYYPSIDGYCASEKAVKLKNAIAILKGAVKDE